MRLQLLWRAESHTNTRALCYPSCGNHLRTHAEVRRESMIGTPPVPPFPIR